MCTYTYGLISYRTPKHTWPLFLRVLSFLPFYLYLSPFLFVPFSSTFYSLISHVHLRAMSAACCLLAVDLCPVSVSICRSLSLPSTSSLLWSSACSLRACALVSCLSHLNSFFLLPLCLAKPFPSALSSRCSSYIVSACFATSQRP